VDGKQENNTWCWRKRKIASRKKVPKVGEEEGSQRRRVCGIGGRGR
jgi:hypothetical protein